MNFLVVIFPATNEEGACIGIFEIPSKFSEELFDLEKRIEASRFHVILVQCQALPSIAFDAMPSEHHHVEALLVRVLQEVGS